MTDIAENPPTGIPQQIEQVKTAQRKEVQEKVDKQREILQEKFPNLPNETNNALARSNTAKLIRIQRLREQRSELIKKASTDSLTGLLNRDGFDQVMLTEAIKSKNRGRPMAVIFMDLNDLKTINDTKGHEEGDKLLKAAAEVIKNTTRSSDAAVRPVDEQSPEDDRNGARWGGDEFGIVLFDSDIAGVAEWWTRRAFPEFERRGISISAGAVVLYPDNIQESHNVKETMDSALTKADSAMYLAKQSGDRSMNQIRITTFNG